MMIVLFRLFQEIMEQLEIIARSAGTTNVNVVSGDKKAVCKVMVSNPIDTVTIIPPEKDLKKKQILQLEARLIRKIQQRIRN